MTKTIDYFKIMNIDKNEETTKYYNTPPTSGLAEGEIAINDFATYTNNPNNKKYINHFKYTTTTPNNSYANFIFKYHPNIEKIYFIEQSISQSEYDLLNQNRNISIFSNVLSSSNTLQLVNFISNLDEDDTTLKIYTINMSTIDSLTSSSSSNAFNNLKDHITNNYPFIIFIQDISSESITKKKCLFLKNIKKYDNNEELKDITKYKFKITTTGSDLDVINYYQSRLLIVGGGGSGGNSIGGGGGGGQVIYINDILLSDKNEYELGVGSGGYENINNTNHSGNISYFNNIFSLGGGNGVSFNQNSPNDYFKKDGYNYENNKGGNSGGHCGKQFANLHQRNAQNDDRILTKENIDNPLSKYNIFNISDNIKGGNSYKLDDITTNSITYSIIRGGGGGGAGSINYANDITIYNTIDTYQHDTNGKGNGLDGINIVDFNEEYCEILINNDLSDLSSLNTCIYRLLENSNIETTNDNYNNELLRITTGHEPIGDNDKIYLGAGGGGGGYNTNLIGSSASNTGGIGGKGGGGNGGIYIQSDNSAIKYTPTNNILFYNSANYNKIRDFRLLQPVGGSQIDNIYVKNLLAKGGNGYPNTGSGGGGGGLYGYGGCGGSGLIVLSINLNDYNPTRNIFVNDENIKKTNQKFEKYKYDLGKNLSILYNYNINENKSFFNYIEKIYNYHFNNDESKIDNIDINLLSLPYNYNVNIYDIKFHLFIYIIYQLKISYDSFLFYKFTSTSSNYDQNDHIYEFILIIKLLRLILKKTIELNYIDNDNNKYFVIYKGYTSSYQDLQNLDNDIKKVIGDKISFEDEKNKFNKIDITSLSSAAAAGAEGAGGTGAASSLPSSSSSDICDLDIDISTYLDLTHKWDYVDTVDTNKKIFVIYTTDTDYNKFSDVEQYIKYTKDKLINTDELKNSNFFDIKYIINLYLLIINKSKKYNYYKLLHSLYFFITFTDYLVNFYKISEKILIGNMIKNEDINTYKNELKYLNEDIFINLEKDINNFKKEKNIYLNKIIKEYLVNLNNKNYTLDKYSNIIKIEFDNGLDVLNFYKTFIDKDKATLLSNEILNYNKEIANANIIKNYVVKYDNKEYELKTIKYISVNKLLIEFYGEKLEDVITNKNIYLIYKNIYINDDIYEYKTNKLNDKNNEIIDHKKNLEKIKQKNIYYNSYYDNFNLKKNIYYLILIISLIIIVTLYLVKIKNSNKNIVIFFIVLLVISLIIYNNYTTKNIISNNNIENFYVDEFNRDKILFEIYDISLENKDEDKKYIIQILDDRNSANIESEVVIENKNSSPSTLFLYFQTDRIFQKLKYLKKRDASLTPADELLKAKEYITKRFKDNIKIKIEYEITSSDDNTSKLLRVENVNYYNDDDYIYIKNIKLDYNDIPVGSEIKSIILIDVKETIITKLLEYQHEIYRDYTGFQISADAKTTDCTIINDDSITNDQDITINMIIYNIETICTDGTKTTLCNKIKQQNIYQINLLKNNFINYMNNIYIEINELFKIIENNNNNKYNEKINRALEYENKNYSIYEEEYSLKKKYNKNVNNMLKHEINNNNNFLNILLVIYLIVLVILLLIEIIPDAYILILSIGLILIIINIVIYTINIKKYNRRNIDKKYF